MWLPFQGKVDRALKLSHERTQAQKMGSAHKAYDEFGNLIEVEDEVEEEKVPAKEIIFMILSAWAYFIPIALAVLGVLVLIVYLFMFH